MKTFLVILVIVLFLGLTIGIHMFRFFQVVSWDDRIAPYVWRLKQLGVACEPQPFFTLRFANILGRYSQGRTDEELGKLLHDFTDEYHQHIEAKLKNVGYRQKNEWRKQQMWADAMSRILEEHPPGSENFREIFSLIGAYDHTSMAFNGFAYDPERQKWFSVNSIRGEGEGDMKVGARARITGWRYRNNDVAALVEEYRREAHEAYKGRNLDVKKHTYF